jgi:protein MAK16
MKTIERAHMPNRWWERIKLPSNYAKALEMLDDRLIYWPKFLVHKCKQRLTRLTQVGIRMKRLAKEELRLGEKLVPRLAPKVVKREQGRERKAEAAAKVERAIERELIERLRSGAYGDRPLNVEESVWKKVLKGLERAGDATQDEDLDEGIEEEEEEAGEFEREVEYEQGVGEVEYVVDEDSESEEDLGDLEDWLGGASADENSEDEDDSSGEEDDDEDEADASEEDASDDEQLKKALGNLKRKRPAGKPPKPAKKPSKGPKREIVYEIENEPAARELVTA